MESESVSKGSAEDAMDQGRESLALPRDDEQTTSTEYRESVENVEISSDAQTSSQDSSSDSSESQDNAIKLFHGAVGGFDGLDGEFREAVEPFFSKAEKAIVRYQFDLSFAKDWLLSVRDVGQRYMMMGCEEQKLEEIVMNRALTTVDQLIDGVETNQEEVFDPRQTMAYLYCAMAVFPITLRLEKGSRGVVYRMSHFGSVSCPQLDVLTGYCAIKMIWEQTNGWQNFAVHKRLLLDLAAWLEVDRAPIAFLITNRAGPLIARLRAESENLTNVPGMETVRERLQRLWDIGIVVAASSLVRKNFLTEAKEYRILLRKVEVAKLPPAVATRYSYVHARLLQNCRELEKALDHARNALDGVTDMEERREIQTLIDELIDALDNAVSQRYARGPPDEQWLTDTNAELSQSRSDLQDEARQTYFAQKQTRRKRTRRVSFPRRDETPSPAPSASGCKSRGATPLRHIQNRSSPRTDSSPCQSVYSSSPASTGSFTTNRGPGTFAPFLSRESLTYSSDLDESEDETDESYTERDIAVFYSSDESEDGTPGEELRPVNRNTDMVAVQSFGGEEEEDKQDWFEKSEQAISEGGMDEEEGEDIGLSDKQTKTFERGAEGRTFYPDFVPNAEQLLKSNPKKYKRCQLKIERAHRAIAKVLDKGSKHSEILIDGRSKAGRTYMDDEVVVEILAEPGDNNGLQVAVGTSAASADESVEKMACGKVVGLLKRVNFANVEHPVLFCTLDELEGHLMKPLCKTVPKIHVMNDTVRSRFPALVKHRIELKSVSPDGDVKFKGFYNVRPDKREQYVFKVVILAWRQRNIYPLGAVLGAYVGGKNYSGGLQVLSMQQRVPKRYPRAAIEDTKKLVQDCIVTKAGRADLTAERTFTIDPPDSKDLDDAISIKRQGPHVIIGVHIADVASVVKKGSGLDLEARRRAVTFYPLNRRPHCMLPEPLSHGKCSLLPGKERLALSVFFKFNDNGNQVDEPTVSRTVIKSNQQLSYEEAQRIIDGQEEVTVEPSVQDDIRQIHKITSKLREGRLKQSMLFVPFEDPRLVECDNMNKSIEAHAVIEELMILTNSYIAKRLSKRPKFCNSMIVRCHKAPTYEELIDWEDREGHVANLVMQLQGKQISPNRQLSLNNNPTPGVYSSQLPIVLQREVWRKLCEHLEQGEIAEARKLAFMDAVHPLQCLATNHWMDLMDTAEYKCSYGLNAPDLRHFGLSLDVYTHFTSPIRRYADLHVQRLLHADLDGRAPDCGPDEVTELCQHINSATSRQKAFGKGCMALKLADTLQHQPLVFRAYVESVDADHLTLYLPSLAKISDRKQELPFSVLGVSSQPEVITNTALRKDTVTVQWNKRGYNATGHCPDILRLFWKRLENNKSKRPNDPVVLTIRPDQLSESVKPQDWIKILKRLVSNNQEALNTVPLSLSKMHSEVDYVSSEKGDGTVVQQPVQFKKEYSRGQIVQVQMSADPRRGMLKPRIEILHTARNASVCTVHVDEPVRTLTRHATRATRGQEFSSYGEYSKAWMPLLEMEAAVGAGEGESAVVIDKVLVIMKSQTSSDTLPYKGSFTLSASFCYKRCIQFGGKSADSIRQEECKSDMSFPLDYLCLRYKADCSSNVVSRIQASDIPETVDRQYTWLAHACVVQVHHKGRKKEDGGELVVTFILSPSSPPPPPQLLKKEGARLTLEILPKAEVDRRAQELLIQLQDEDLTLARAIAFGSKFPKLDADHEKLGRKDGNHEVFLPECEKLPVNNKAQLEAIQKAMTQSVTMIQGPPGSGKTNTGIKLVYLYCKINRQLEAEGKGKKTVLYCGPSNKSVDLVARELKLKLDPEHCPKIVRVYGSAIESRDYPVPTGDLRPIRGMRDLKGDPSLQDVALHHLIRQDGKPYAEDIAEFEKFFDKCRSHPNNFSVTDKQLRDYRKLLYKASVEELKHYEVILATCAVGGCRKVVEGTENSVFQLIIDECAMSHEPQSMVPIIATRPQQVVLIGDHKQLRPIIKCQAAAELGLDQSLFERLFQRFQGNTAFLDRQYRMHPKICAFPSKEFYNGGLKTRYSVHWGGDPPLSFWPSHPNNPKKRVPHLLVNVRGEEEMLTVSTDEGNERSKSNRLEADKVIEIVKFLKQRHKIDLLKIKILTQYNAQRHLLEEMLKTAVEQNKDVFEHYDKFKVKVSTVVSSQGGEWDYVILSTVRSLPSYKIEPNPTHGWCRLNLGFITDQNQVNVALTRARRGLFIVGNVELLRCDDVWRHLVERYQWMGCCVEDPTLFPPPPPPIRRYQRHRHTQHNASLEWKQA